MPEPAPACWPRPVWTALFQEMVRCWPREGCGVVTGRPGEEAGARFTPFENLQDRLHAADPEAHPRDARTAYALDPLALERLLEAEKAAGRALLAIVHSHPEHDAYLSETDRRAAAPFGSPTFPRAVQVVVSVRGGRVVQVGAWRWRDGDWARCPVAGHPPLPWPHGAG